MGVDRISELPETLLTQILSHLPTKVSVRTSVLSKRWKPRWRSVPALDLDLFDFPHPYCQACDSFIDKFLEFNSKSGMQKFKLKYKTSSTFRGFSKRIGTAIDLGIQHLDVEAAVSFYLPLTIYESTTLVSLKLVSTEFPDPEFGVSLPCLKILHLEDICYEYDPLIMENVISGCPALEDLTLIRFLDHNNLDVPQFLPVRSQSIKSFRLTLDFGDGLAETCFSVEIDAPRLEYLSFKDNQSDEIVVKNLNSLSMIDIDTDFDLEYGGTDLSPRKRDTVRGFLTGISNVRHMIISQRTLELLSQYPELGPIPKFDNLYRLEVAFSCCTLQFLPVFLESCPNLKKLIVDFANTAQPKKIELNYVPRCLISTLECVKMNKLIMWDETGINLINYFLENSAVLKTLSVSFTYSPMSNKERHIYTNVLLSTRLSRKCQVFLY